MNNNPSFCPSALLSQRYFPSLSDVLVMGLKTIRNLIKYKLYMAMKSIKDTFTGGK